MLQPLQLLRGKRSVEGKVEGGVVGGDQRSPLEVAPPQQLLQRPVEEVGGRVVTHDLAAAPGVDAGSNSLAHPDPADANTAEVGDHALERPLGVLDEDLALRPDQASGVAHLASRLGVKGAPVQVHLDLVALGRVGHLGAVAAQRQHGALVLGPVVARELGAWERP